MAKGDAYFTTDNVRQIKFSIIIPAYNEEKYLAKCLDSIIAAAPDYRGRIEVIVVLNRCTDRTEEIALSYGCVTVRDDSKNLAKIRNTGAKIARGEILVTIDADSRMSGNMLSEIEKKLSTGKYIGGAVVVKPERISPGIIASLLLLRGLVMIKYGWISAGLFWCFKQDYEAVNGFNENLLSAEDIDFALRLKKWGREKGKAFGILWKAFIVTSCRKYDLFGDWYLIKSPCLVLEALKGQNRSLADRVWYDVKR